MTSINLVLEKYQYQVHEKIVGKVVLTLDGPIKADKLSVNFTVTKLVKSMGVPSMSQVSISSSSSTASVYTFDLTLDGAKEYISGEYPFEMIIPADAVPQGGASLGDSIGGALGSAVGMLTQFFPMGQATYHYTLEARLDVPWNIDMTKKVDITVG